MNKLKIIPIKLLVLIAMPLILSSVIGGLVGAYIVQHSPSTKQEKMTEFYQAEMSTVVSPSTLKKMIEVKRESL